MQTLKSVKKLELESNADSSNFDNNILGNGMRHTALSNEVLAAFIALYGFDPTSTLIVNKVDYDKLAAENAALKSHYLKGLVCEDISSPLTPCTDAVIAEIKAQAVKDFASHAIAGDDEDENEERYSLASIHFAAEMYVEELLAGIEA